MCHSVLLLVQREANLVHQIVNFRLQCLDNVGVDEQMFLVEILQDELSTQQQLFVQMQQKLFHSRITGMRKGGNLFIRHSINQNNSSFYTTQIDRLVTSIARKS